MIYIYIYKGLACHADSIPEIILNLFLLQLRETFHGIKAFSVSWAGIKAFSVSWARNKFPFCKTVIFRWYLLSRRIFPLWFFI